MSEIACTSWEVDGYEVLRHWQGGRCAMCGLRDRLVMDHDHTTGLIRGWLCRSCNGLEATSGHPKWDEWRGGANPAAMLGVTEEYVHLMPGAAILERMAREEAADPALRDEAKRRAAAAVAGIDVADQIAEAVAR